MGAGGRATEGGPTTAPPVAPGPARAARVRRHPALRVAALYVPTLLIVVTVVLALPRAMPGDPLSVFDDPDNNLFVSDEESRERLLSHYGLDEPLPSQYVEYLSRVVRGDLGWSISRNVPVSTLVGRHLPWTVSRFTPKSAELIKEYLREVGIEVDIKALDRAAADDAAAKGNFTMALVGYGGIMGDPETLTTRFSSKSKGGGFSRAQGYVNPEFDALAQKQLATLDESQRRREVVKLQGMLAADLPVLSLYVPDRVTIFRKGGFANWYHTPGCSPCGATNNKHMLVTGRKVGFPKGGRG